MNRSSVIFALMSLSALSQPFFTVPCYGNDHIATLSGHWSSVWSVSFSPDGKTLASGSSDETIELWDVATRENIATLIGHRSSVNSVSFSPDGKVLASGALLDRAIELWDVATRENIATLIGHRSSVNSVSFSPDGKTLASGSDDDTIKLWDVSEWGTVVETAPTPDFDGNEQVDFADFLAFVARFGTSQGDAGFDARFDLDGDGKIGFGDFLIFADSFDASG